MTTIDFDVKDMKNCIECGKCFILPEAKRHFPIKICSDVCRKKRHNRRAKEYAAKQAEKKRSSILFRLRVKFSNFKSWYKNSRIVIFITKWNNFLKFGVILVLIGLILFGLFKL